MYLLIMYGNFSDILSNLHQGLTCNAYILFVEQLEAHLWNSESFATMNDCIMVMVAVPKRVVTVGLFFVCLFIFFVTFFKLLEQFKLNLKMSYNFSKLLYLCDMFPRHVAYCILPNLCNHFFFHFECYGFL